MERPVDDVHLLLAGEAHEIDGIARDANRQIRVLLRVIHRVQQRVAIEHVDVHVIAGAAEERVEDAGEVRDPILGDAPETGRHERRRQRDTVRGIAVRDLGDRSGRGVNAVAVAAVHRVCARRERLAATASVRRVAGRLAVHDVRGDRQDRLRVDGVAIRRVLSQLAHERAHQPDGELIHRLSLLPKQRELALGLIVGHEPCFVADDAYLRVPDRRQAVGDDRHAGHAERHGPQRRVIVQRHFDALVGVLVVHVVDDVHGVDVHAGEPVHHPVELVNHVFEFEDVAFHGFEGGTYLIAADLVPAAVDGVEQTLREVGARAEELHLLADQHR